MKAIKKQKILVGFLFVVIVLSCIIIPNYLLGCKAKNVINQTSSVNKEQFTNCVAGLLSDNTGGSSFVIYDTKKWNSKVILNLPDVSPDNYCAITSDGSYIAYTKWDDNFTRRYLIIYTVSDGSKKSYYKDIPVMNEIKGISWLPDNQTLLFIKNDQRVSSYQEIHTLNIKTGMDKTIVKGEAWLICSPEKKGITADNFYLKGNNSYLKVKNKKPVQTKKSKQSDEEWNYYLNQNDINNIYHKYGGHGSFDINNINQFMYVKFSDPKCSSNGTKIIFSAALTRSSAPGIGTPLWMCSSIWEYDMNTDKSSIVYTQKDAAAIGRVDWIGNNEVSFISYYDFQGSRDSVNHLNLSTKKNSIIFPYSDKNYNNVTLLPVGNRKIIFTSSKKNDSFDKSNTILFDINTNKYSTLNILFNNKKVLLENFIFAQLENKVINSETSKAK